MTDADPERAKTTLTGTAIIYTVVALVGIGLAAIIGVSITNNRDSTPLVTSIVGLIVPTIGVLLTLVKVEQVHKVVNSAAAELARQNERIIAIRDATIVAQSQKIADQQAKLEDRKPKPPT